MVMRTFAILLVLLGHCFVPNAAPAANPTTANSVARTIRLASRNSQAACKSEYDICMKHCRRK